MIRRRDVTFGLLAALAATTARPIRASAQTAASSEQQTLVDRAKVTVEGFAADREFASLRRQLASARGVIIIPDFFKASFIVGGAGGSAVLAARDPQSSEWSAPAFYLLAGGSLGLQIGGELSEVMLVIRTERGLDAVLRNRFKIGADVTMAAGPIGKTLEAATTTNFQTDILSYSRARGLAVGLSIDGAYLQPRDLWNDVYYGKPTTTRQVLAGEVEGMGSQGLRDALKAAEQAG